jgi:chromosome segregation ATPase
MSDVRKVPKNLRLGITLQGDQYYPAPNYRTYCAKNLSVRYFDRNTNREEVINKLEEKIRGLSEEMKEWEQQLSDVKVDIHKLNEFSRKSEAHYRSLREQDVQLHRRIRELKDEEETQPVTATKAALEEELKLLEEAHKTTQSKLEQVEKDMTKFKDRLSMCQERTAGLKKEEADCNEKYNSAKEKLEELRNKEKHEKHRQTTLKSKVEELNRLIGEKDKQERRHRHLYY